MSGPLTEGERRRIVELAQQGRSMTEIAADIGRSRRAVTGYCGHHRIPVTRKAAGPQARRERAPDAVLVARDARLAADTRSPAQIWLNDPPPGRSALAQRNAAG
jgi:IS30 family transposase